MVYFLTTSLLCSIVLFGIGLLVLTKNYRGRLNQLFFAFCTLYSLNSLGAAVAYFINNIEVAYTIWVLLAVASVLAQSTFMFFVQEFIGVPWLKYRKVGLSHVLFGLICCCILASLPYKATKSGLFWLFETSPYMYVIYFLFTAFTFCFVFYLLRTHYKKNRNTLIADQITYFSISVSFVFVAVMIDILQQIIVCNFFPTSGVPLTFNLTYIASIIFAILVSYTIIKHKFLDIYSALHHASAWLLILILSCLPFGVGIYLVADYPFTNPVGKFVSILFLSITNIIVFSIIKPRIDHLFFRRKYQFLALLSEYQERFSGINDIEIINMHLKEALNQSVYPERYGFYRYRTRNKESWFELINKNTVFMDLISAQSIPFQILPNQFLWLSKKSAVDTQNEKLFLTPDTLKKQPASTLKVIVPLHFKEALLGIIVLENKKNCSAYNNADRLFLRKLSTQLAGALRNLELLTQIDQERREKVQIAERERHATEINYFISHEVKDPLYIIYGHTKHILSNPNNDQETLKRGGYILKECTQLSQFLNNYLLYEKLGAGLDSLSLTELDATLLLEEAIKKYVPLIDEKELTIKRNFIEATLISADRDKLLAVFGNILSNAVKYSIKGRHIELHTLMKDGHFIIIMRDFGVGIPANVIPNLFNQFFNSPNQKSDIELSGSSGLGLFICKRILSLHSGTISIESQEDIGTCVTIQLPQGRK